MAITRNRILLIASAQPRSFGKLFTDGKLPRLLLRQFASFYFCFLMSSGLLEQRDYLFGVLRIVVRKLLRFSQRYQGRAVVFCTCVDAGERIVEFGHLRLVVEGGVILPRRTREVALRLVDPRQHNIPAIILVCLARDLLVVIEQLIAAT